NAAQQQAAAAATAAAASALMNAATSRDIVPTRDVAEGAKGAGEGAGKAGAQAPDGGESKAGKTEGPKAGDDAGKPGGDKEAAGKDAQPGPHDIAITLQDAQGNPGPNIKWQVTLPDNSTKTGTTGDDGKISVKGLTQDGGYKLDLPDLDKVSPPPSGDTDAGAVPKGGGGDTPSGDGGTQTKEDQPKQDQPAQDAGSSGAYGADKPLPKAIDYPGGDDHGLKRDDGTPFPPSTPGKIELVKPDKPAQPDCWKPVQFLNHTHSLP